MWQAGDPVLATLPVLRNAMTMATRFSDLELNGDLLFWKDEHNRDIVRWSIGEMSKKLSLVVAITTDARPEPLRLSAPLDAIQAGAPHEVVLRYSGNYLELFVDGVLVDEEWPFGALGSAHGAVTVEANSLASIVLWDRSLSDEELQNMFGDKAKTVAREESYLGPKKPVAQYWRPRGFNVHVGDCMPFFHAGRFHLFYLFDRRNHGSKWWLGAHQWAHVSTTDLVHWDEHPLAIAITDVKEGSICTGSVFFQGDTYYAFYAVRTNDGSPAPLCASTSNDGINFSKHPPLAKLEAPYNPGPGRDPVVFTDPNTGLFNMLVSTELLDPPIPGRGGCLAHLVSRDLKHWNQLDPFLVPGYPDVPECPDYFEWHGWYYLVFSNGAVARYRMSRQPFGPWLRPEVDVFDGPKAGVMKTAQFHGDRRLGAAFLPVDSYGGDLVFREIIQHADGTLGTKWPAEMIPPTDACPALQLKPLTSGASGNINAIVLRAPQGLETALLRGAPRDFLLRARICPEPGTSFFGVRFRASDKLEGGFELLFEPQREKVGLRPPGMMPAIENETMAIYNVSNLDKPFSFELLVKDDVVDLCVDKRRTLIARTGPNAGENLLFFTQNGAVIVEHIEVNSIVEGAHPT